MVFFGPGFVNIPCAHGAVGAFHTDRTDIDMPHKHGHHQHRGNAMDHVDHLHGAALVDQTGNDFVEHKARGNDYCPQQKYATPKNDFFTRIEAMRRNFFATQNATAFEQPHQVTFGRHVVFYEGEKHND